MPFLLTFKYFTFKIVKEIAVRYSVDLGLEVQREWEVKKVVFLTF